MLTRSKPVQPPVRATKPVLRRATCTKVHGTGHLAYTYVRSARDGWVICAAPVVVTKVKTAVASV